MAAIAEHTDRTLLDGLTATASRAAAAILTAREQNLASREKPDRSPVTAADEAAEAVILSDLARLLPGMPVISEEASSRQMPSALGGTFALVDPLDGTRELLAGRDEFAVNIALIRDGTPFAGVIAAPARGLIWRGLVGAGAERMALAPGAPPAAARDRQAIRTRRWPERGARVLVSRSHLDPATTAYVDRLPPTERLACGSALKFCLIAEGSADIYPRLARTCEWDVAAGHALVVAAGGTLTRPNGEPLLYGRGDFYIAGFIAAGDPARLVPV
jgi:3'(2'), 5'-bisphosphate nucleotidase